MTFLTEEHTDTLHFIYHGGANSGGSTPIGDAVVNFEKIIFSTTTSGSYKFNLGSQAGSAGESITVEVVQTRGMTAYGIDFTSATDANIILTGSNGDDNGNNGDDIVVLGSGNDNVTLRLGDDTITAGAGNDIINGGGGIDTAIFSGNKSDYTIVKISNTNYSNRQ